MASEFSLSGIGLRSVRRLSDRELAVKLDELNTKKYALDAELLLYLSEVERRRLYREHACSSLFDFCVTRLGQSEDVAYKRVGAARLMLKYPEIYELLASGRIHLSGLMLLRPHLNPDRCQELLLAACGKSKRRIELLIATRFPQPDVPTTQRRVPKPKLRGDLSNCGTGEAAQDPAATETDASSLTAASATSATARVTSTSVDEMSVVGTHVAATPSSTDASSLTAASATSATARVTSESVDEMSVVGTHVTATKTTSPLQSSSLQAAPSKSNSAAARSRVDPLSDHSYRVTFTASACLKQKMDRARELLSHAIPPSDLPALLERALDQLIEREERRRYGSPRCVASNPALRESEIPRSEASKREIPRSEASKREIPRSEASKGAVQQDAARQDGPCQLELHHGELHASCQKRRASSTESQDPDPNFGTRAKPRSRHVPAKIRRAVWVRDDGQCTFVDHTGRRCEQRHFLELDHREAFALGGCATVENLRLRCRAHNALEAEKLFGRDRIERTIAHVKHERADCVVE